jgi:PKD repeat protein
LDKWLRPRPIADFAFADAASGVSFTNNSQKADSYLWDFADGTTDTAANPTHIFPAQGTYNVKLIAMRHCNVTDTITQAVTAMAGAGMDEIFGETISLYPNPATNYLRISGLDNATRIAVLSADGKKVLETNISGNTQQIDTKSFAQGIYIVEISNGQGLVARKKFIKK